jgi:hypothetical protein
VSCSAARKTNEPTSAPARSTGLAPEPEGRTMQRRRLLAAFAATVALGMLGSTPALARDASPESLTVTAAVVDQKCQPNGDFVDVTLSATAQSSSRIRGYRWDFTNNGTFDTALLGDPTIVHAYPDEVSVTARVGAINRQGDRAMDTVNFATLRCP